jgi:hypothetical protein
MTVADQTVGPTYHRFGQTMVLHDREGTLPGEGGMGGAGQEVPIMSDIDPLGPAFTMAEPTILRVADLYGQEHVSLALRLDSSSRVPDRPPFWKSLIRLIYSNREC